VSGSPRAKSLLAGAATLLAAGAAFGVWRACGGPRRVTVESDPSATDEVTWNGQQPYVVDAVAGLRCRRLSTVRHPMTGLDLSDPQPEITKHRDANAFLRDTALPVPLDRPAVLVVGDSHVDGVVSTPDNFTSLLEAASASSATPYYCLNAGCGLYSLWQDVLRARDLLANWRPRVVVIVVFLGNDFLDLDNPKVPHLDDELHELPGAELHEPETTSERKDALGLQHPHTELFRQGLNQALLAQREPARIARWMHKAGHAVAAMERAAAEHDARVLWALLPSCDLVFPEHAKSLSPLAAEVVASGAQRRVRDAFAAVLAAQNARVVDLEPAFRTDGSLALYALDYHIYRRGHRAVFEALAPAIAELLAK
jgi:hypothetical protein